jgi:GNAT superfamily N-acetyltransferase
LREVRCRYLRNPCRVSCIALWKLEQRCRAGRAYLIESEGQSTLYAIADRRLEFYWSGDKDHFALAPSEVAVLDLLVLHENDYNLIANQLVGCEVTRSNPMIYASRDLPSAPRIRDVNVADFDFDREDDFAAAADLLNRCYPGHRHTGVEIARWTQSPAFAPGLWFWIRERGSDAALALAISTYQPSIRETYLDWIQVLPEAQGRGLGRLLVNETLRRALSTSDIVRVTGVADAFYRACGFESRERWCVVRRV